MLYKKITDIIKNYNTNGNIAIYDLNKNKFVVNINERNKIKAASTIKIIIAVHALKKVLKGEISLDHKITIKREDFVDYSMIKNLSISEYKIRDLLTIMLTLSDNTAANALIEFFTFEEINKTIKELQLADTMLKRKMMDFKAVEAGCENLTSAYDMCSLILMIYKCSVLDQNLCSYLLEIMSIVKDNDPIRKYIGEKIYIANKPGELDFLNCDVGMYKTGGVSYIISMFVFGEDNISTKECISQISKAAYEYFTSEKEIAKKAVVSAAIAPLKTFPKDGGETSDELLCGCAVDIAENLKNGWYRIVTNYGYGGFIKNCHIKNPVDFSYNGIVSHTSADLTLEPKYESEVVCCLYMGTLLNILDETIDRWVKVRLIDGRIGWIRKDFIKKYAVLNKRSISGTSMSFKDRFTYMRLPPDIEEHYRCDIVRTASQFLNVQYRWGGKSSMGIDCSGLSSIAYFVNGIVIPRDADIQQGFMIDIQRNQLKKGDLLFFPGHVAIYMGNFRYIHSTGREGMVVINSLNKKDTDYREDLDKNLSGCGTVFSE